MSDMQTAYKVAAAAVRQRLKEQHPDDLAILNGIRNGDVAVYSGSFDRVEDILKCLNVPMTIDPNLNKLSAKIVFVNCSSSYEDAKVVCLKSYVEKGTWLVSSDWALGHFVAKAFPNTIRWNQQTTGDEVISVEPSLESLWSDVVVLGAQPQWWLETSSHPIEILNPNLVSIEAASHELLVNHNAPVVAVSFNWGKGHVFHVISHFWCKRSRQPSPRYQGPCTDFLQAGMRLSDDGIDKVLRDTGIKSDTLNFAQLQSAATSTELVAQLCVRAIKSATPSAPCASACSTL